ncbi:hypothetical protein LBMAG46_34920 [Planctomycetia bacterium]|nr:hypothetical protein LBMAG46_34920 [Planctomycetia bacterium]
MSPSSSDPQHDLFLELLSARHDGELTADEQRVLQPLMAQDPQQAGQFQDGCRQLSGVLRRLPQRPLPGPIFSAASDSQVPWLVRLPDDRGRRRARLAAIVSTLAVLGLLFMFTRNPPDQSGLIARRAPAVLTDSALQTIPSDNAEVVAPSELMAAAEAAPAPSPAAFTAPAEVFADQPVLSETAAPQVDPQQVQLLADTADWKVVLVKVGTVDRGDVKDRVSKVLQQHGLLLADTTPVQMPEWLGVVLTADSLLQQSLIQAVSVAVDGQASEWNPGQILSASREEIIAAVRRSLSSPTQAELARGEVYVAVRDDISGLAKAGADSLARAKANRLDFYNGLNGAKSTAAAGRPQPSGVAAAAKVPAPQPDAASGAGQVTLFVFQFADAADASGSPDQQLPGKVRNLF